MADKNKTILIAHYLIDAEVSDTMYEEVLHEYKAKAELKKKEFLSLDPEILSKDHLALFIMFYDCYTDLALHPDEEVILKFKELGMNRFWLKWMIPIAEIENELDKISQDGKITVLKYPLIYLIKEHLKVKIAVELQDWWDMFITYNKEEMPAAKKVIVSAYRKRDDAGGEPKKFESIEELTRQKIITQYEKEFGGRDIVKGELFEILSGNTKNAILRPMVYCFVNKGKLKKTDFCNRIYDFYRLIMKDDETMYATEQEFLDKAPDTYRTFRIYRYQRIYNMFVK